MPNDFNDKIIAEFHANDGRVGGPFAGAPMVLLTTTGARTARPHTTPLVPLIDDDGSMHVFGSMGGAPKHPSWYFNLRAHPEVTVERGTEKFKAKAEIITGPERDRIYAKQAARLPSFADYQKKTTRTIPVIALRRVG